MLFQIDCREVELFFLDALEIVRISDRLAAWDGTWAEADELALDVAMVVTPLEYASGTAATVPVELDAGVGVVVVVEVGVGVVVGVG